MEYKPEPRKVERTPECIRAIYGTLQQETESSWLENLAAELGVSAQSAKAIGAAWSHRKQAWAFLCGMESVTWWVSGCVVAMGRSGPSLEVLMLFIPADIYVGQTVYLVEGPTIRQWLDSTLG